MVKFNLRVDGHDVVNTRMHLGLLSIDLRDGSSISFHDRAAQLIGEEVVNDRISAMPEDVQGEIEDYLTSAFNRWSDSAVKHKKKGEVDAERVCQAKASEYERALAVLGVTGVEARRPHVDVAAE